MASTTTDVTPPQGPSQTIGANSTIRGGNRGYGRGGRGGGPGGAGEGREGRSGYRRARGNWARGRGGRGGGRQQHHTQPQGAASGAEGGELQPRASILGGPDEPKATAGVKPDADDAASDPDSPVCFICADPVTYSAIAPCNHVTCHICALRMRALYKNKACAHCRTEAEWVVFSKDESKKFLEFKDSEIVRVNRALGIRIDDLAIYDDTTLLLRYNCPDKDCDRICRSWPDLHHHVRSTHNRVLCDLCVRGKKSFAHEHTLFTTQDLRKHERTGDDQPGSENQSGFKGHPECEFCRQRFYSSDEIFAHCRDKHERCHICDRRNTSTHQQYYIDYDALANHFSKDHFMCADEECLEKKFVVFENEVDLKAHQLEAHPEGLSKNAKRDVRRIDITQFALEDHNQDRGGNRRRRNDDRGQQEREEAPINTAQQMNRAELAYHRTLAVLSSQSITSRNFGGQLTEPALAVRPSPPTAVRPVQGIVTALQAPSPATVRPVQSATTAHPPVRPVQSTTTAVQAPPPTVRPVQSATTAHPPVRPAQSTTTAVQAPPPTVRPVQSMTTAVQAPPARPPARPAELPAAVAQAAFPPLVRLQNVSEAGPSGTNRGLPVTDEVKRSRHNAVIERVSTMLQYSESKIKNLKSDVSRYNQGHLTAGSLVEQFWALFDVKVPELGILIKELADLFEDEPKRQGLLKAWNDWKVTNEDYPPFAGASSSSTGGNQNSSRILKVKSSTSHSARSTTARQGSWGAAASVPSTSSSPMPTPRPVPHSANRRGAGVHAPKPRVVPSAVPGPSSSSAGPSRKAGATDEFPSLPVKAPPPPGWGPIKKKDPYAAQASAWGGGGSGEQSAEPSESEGVGGSGGGGKKKKGKQKQILFQVGVGMI